MLLYFIKKGFSSKCHCSQKKSYCSGYLAWKYSQKDCIIKACMNFVIRLDCLKASITSSIFSGSFWKLYYIYSGISRVSLFSCTLIYTESLDSPFTNSDFVHHLERKRSPEDFQETLLLKNRLNAEMACFIKQSNIFICRKARENLPSVFTSENS